MEKTMTLTLREAAFVFGGKLKEIVRIVEEHAALTTTVARGGRNLRVLGMPDLIYLQALGEVGEMLSPLGRFQLHEALLDGLAKHEVAVGTFLLPLDPLKINVEKRLEALEKLKDGVDGNPDDPFIKGTEIEVYRISALLDGGATPEDVVRDYPSLVPEQIEVARAYAEAIPKKGRPYPKTSFKSAVRRLNLDALEEALAEEEGQG